MTTNEEERLTLALHRLVDDERPSPLMSERVAGGEPLRAV